MHTGRISCCRSFPLAGSERMKSVGLALVLCACAVSRAWAQGAGQQSAINATPLAIGETFTMASKALE